MKAKIIPAIKTVEKINTYTSHKYIKNTSTCGVILTEYLLKADSPHTKKLQERSPRIWVGRKKEVGTGSRPSGRTCERGKVPSPWEPLSLAEMSTRMERELQRLRAECNN